MQNLSLGKKDVQSKYDEISVTLLRMVKYIHTVFIRFSALGAYLIFEPSGWALIRGGRLFEVGRLLNFQHFS